MFKFKIKAIREKKGLNQKQAAKLIGMPEPQLCKYEAMKPGDAPPRFKTLENIALKLGVSVRDLIPVEKGRKDIVFFNFKGGTGKSSMLLITAQVLSEKGYSVVVLDNDPQGTSTMFFLNRIQDEKESIEMNKRIISHNIFSLMKGHSSLEECLFEFKETNIKLIGSTNKFKDAADEFSKRGGAENIQKKKLRELDCDFLLVDTPGFPGPIGNWSLALADILLIPCRTESPAVECLPETFDAIENAQELYNEDLEDIYVIPNEFKEQQNNNKAALEVLEEEYSEFVLFNESKKAELIKSSVAVSDYVTGAAKGIPKSSQAYQSILNIIENYLNF
jgi:chromosome partitioning protein